MSKTGWEHYSHPADVGIRGFGPTKAEAFAQAGVALTAVVADVENVDPEEEVKISCDEEDVELLFVTWLNTLLYETATRNMLFCEFEVEIEGSRLRAKAWGQKLDVSKHNPTVEVKAATCSDLKVEQGTEGNWTVQCIVDV
jgi:tRNA nucleotidyltransferase (CCA-adding enzyme)